MREKAGYVLVLLVGVLVAVLEVLLALRAKL